jgi:WD40 repeat protein
VYRFDQTLVNPSPKLLQETLTKAAQTVNKGVRSRLLQTPIADWPKFIKQWRRDAEGHYQWNAPGEFRRGGPGGDTRSVAAIGWWSDRIDRKHCRVVADRVDCASQKEADLFQPDSDPHREARERPVLWRVYPDNLYLRATGKQWQLWAACPCGRAGTPEELGWMGPCCAACHDQSEERGSLATFRPTVLSGHSFWVSDVAFGLDGLVLLTRTKYHPEIWIWDTRTGDVEKRRFPQLVLGLAVAPDGRRAAVCMDNEIRVWSLIDADEQLLIPQENPPLPDPVRLAFSPDGELLACTSARPVVTVYELKTGRVRWSQSLQAGADGLAFSPDGGMLAVGLGEPAVRCWNVANGRELPPFPGDLEHHVCVAFSPDGNRLAAGAYFYHPNLLRLWDVASREEKATFPGPISQVAFSPNGRLLATVGRDGRLCLHHGSSGKLLGMFRWHQSDIDTVAFSPDGSWLATGGHEDRVKLWPVDALISSSRIASAASRITP